MQKIRAYFLKLIMMTDLTRKIAERVCHQSKSIWNEFTVLARECKAVNIGQGFTDSRPPDFVVDAMKCVSNSPDFMLHQYTRGFGHPRLVNVMAQLYGDLLGLKIDPLNEITISVGGYNALFMAIFAFIDPGDEAIIIEPYFDCYSSQVEMAGGVPVFVPLICGKPNPTSADFQLDMQEFESKFTPKTKLLILNNPNNPLGKVFTRQELIDIANVAKKYNVIVISDEVYEFLVYPGSEMIRFASLPGMFDRTITVGSAGKVFSVTGWKLGWAIAPKCISEALRALHQNCTYTCPTVIQEAVAIAFEHELPLLGTEKSYFKQLVDLLLLKRAKMNRFLLEAGMKPVLPEGGYFIMADYTALHGPFENSIGEKGEGKDFTFVRWLCREKKLAGIPPSAFYSKPHKHIGENFIRFCFFKENSTLDAAEKIVKEWKASL